MWIYHVLSMVAWVISEAMASKYSLKTCRLDYLVISVRDCVPSLPPYGSWDRLQPDHKPESDKQKQMNGLVFLVIDMSLNAANENRLKMF